MFLNDLKKFMIERGMKGYDFLFILGLFVFIFVYLKTNAFLSAIILASFVWLVSLVIFLCYKFELGDVGSFYNELKKNKSPKGSKVVNMFLLASILLVGSIGGFCGVLIGTILLGHNGLVVGLGIALGAIIALKLYYVTILKRF